jgi:hypothetical protein
MSVFHIHIDARSITPSFEDYLSELGFVRTDFAGHPDGADGFEAPNHLTLKLTDSEKFRDTFEAITSRAAASAGICGYVEGEFIPLDQDVPDKPYQPGVAVPFRIENQPIAAGKFRETEIHITLDRDRSDPRLIASLTDMGFFSAYMRKPYGVAQIFTVQGSRPDVNQLLPRLLDYLENCGGTAHCSVKEERVAKWWLSDPSVALPPVIGAIEWERKGRGGALETATVLRGIP